MDNWLTLKEIEKLTGVKVDTLGAYLRRNEVIPENKRIKKGNIWLIDREWIEEKYKDKIETLENLELEKIEKRNKVMRDLEIEKISSTRYEIKKGYGSDLFVYLDSKKELSEDEMIKELEKELGKPEDENYYKEYIQDGWIYQYENVLIIESDGLNSFTKETLDKLLNHICE